MAMDLLAWEPLRFVSTISSAHLSWCYASSLKCKLGRREPPKFF